MRTLLKSHFDPLIFFIMHKIEQSLKRISNLEIKIA